MTEQTSIEPLVLFDGPCNLCSRAVRFIIRHEKGDALNFASLQSDIGKKVLGEHQLAEDLDAMVFIHEGSALSGSDAALALAGWLRFPWSMLKVFRILPARMHRAMYRGLANRRYKWFGRQEEESCPLPDPKLSHRFLHS